MRSTIGVVYNELGIAHKMRNTYVNGVIASLTNSLDIWVLVVV